MILLQTLFQRVDVVMTLDQTIPVFLTLFENPLHLLIRLVARFSLASLAVLLQISPLDLQALPLPGDAESLGGDVVFAADQILDALKILFGLSCLGLRDLLKEPDLRVSR